jgi:hypothetical protein
MIIIGSANILDLEKFQDERGSEILDPNDPIRVKKELGLGDITENLFPTINTGVRYWPFLLVARDLYKSRSKEAVQKKLKQINARQDQKNIGPLKFSTFLYYRGMFRRIKGNDSSDSLDLRRFLNDRRRKYDGNFDFFQRNGNEKKWKRVLVKSMGIPGKQFANLLGRLAKYEKRKANNNDNEIHIVDRAITHILDNKHKYDKLLWKGAFCYAFLRCMYGINDLEQVNPPAQVKKWAESLTRALGSPKGRELRHLRKYIPLIIRSTASPPWKNKSKEMKNKNRNVLSNIRFFVFYNLYIRPSPKRVIEW